MACMPPPPPPNGEFPAITQRIALGITRRPSSYSPSEKLRFPAVFPPFPAVFSPFRRRLSMLARRFACPPVEEAPYDPRQIPHATPSLEGSVLLRPARDLWLSLLGEMAQMLSEAVRRRAGGARAFAKPLSLEYLADRLDVDDPLLGYLLVTRAEGWMQGFLTATTFTTWHVRFRWDSTHPSLAWEEEEEGGELPRVDTTGELAAALQAQLHAGDPEREGVVWPRVAELSLLGALGCGRRLVELLLDELEEEGSPYEFVVTQATDGSRRFYERMGFVRVGAVTYRAREGQPEASGGGKHPPKRRRAEGAAAGGSWVASEHFEYRTQEGGETVDAIAGRFEVEAWEVLFLNERRHPKLQASSPLRKDTRLLIPRHPDVARVHAQTTAMHPRYHVVAEDTPFKTLAERLAVDARALLRANQPQLRGLHLSSELRRGTRLLLAPPAYDADEYCHWSFPDDDPALAEPSYMMARRLAPRGARRGGGARAAVAQLMAEERPRVLPGGKRAPFLEAIRKAKAEEAARRAAAEAEAWVQVGESLPFKKHAEALRLEPRALLALNAPRLKGLQLSSIVKRHTWLQLKPIDAPPPPPRPSLVNQVVRIDGEDEYEYWYVLTYLPDLQWCHVAPLERRGEFNDKPAPSGHVALGRTRWMLVSEDEGGEIDVGAGRCHVMQSVEMRGTKANADAEEWDIIGPAPPGWVGPASTARSAKKKKKENPLASPVHEEAANGGV